MASQSQIQMPSLTMNSSNNRVHKTLAIAGNLANLLPTGTVLAFQALTPSFSNNGDCQLPNKYLIASLILFCSISCFLSSFTDSFQDNEAGKVYYGIATFKGLYIFNDKTFQDKKALEKFRISFIDFVHASVSLLVFLIFSLGDSNVQGCYLTHHGIESLGHYKALIINLPLGAGVLSSFLFAIFPTTRRGIGYADLVAHA